MQTTKQTIINYIGVFVAGVAIALFALHAYFFYQLRAVVAQDHANLTAVIQLIQQSQQAGQPTSNSSSPQAE
jgi:hypothetical protein